MKTLGRFLLEWTELILSGTLILDGGIMLLHGEATLTASEIAPLCIGMAAILLRRAAP